MTTSPESLSHEQRVRALAERADYCPQKRVVSSGEGTNYYTCDCHDIGAMVPRYPMLRSECYGCGGKGRIYPGGTPCPLCPALPPKSLVDFSNPEGRGWGPNMSQEALTEAVVSAGLRIRLSREGRNWRVALYLAHDSVSRGTGEGKTLNEALSLALMRREMAHEAAHPGR